MKTAPDSTQRIDVRIAKTFEDYAVAFRIAYEVYYAKGFIPFRPSGMRATPYQFQPGSVVLIAYADEKPVGTLSLYEGHGSDLPSASGWPEELKKFDPRGLRLFELGALMVSPKTSQTGTPSLCLEMFRHAWHYARHIRKANGFCAFVQAHHRVYYVKMLGFTPFGPARDYLWNGLQIDAVAPFYLNLDTAEESYRKRFSRHGDSARNLYRFFVLEQAHALQRKLRLESKQLARLDKTALARHFRHLLPGHRTPPRACKNDQRQEQDGGRALNPKALACVSAY